MIMLARYTLMSLTNVGPFKTRMMYTCIYITIIIKCYKNGIYRSHNNNYCFLVIMDNLVWQYVVPYNVIM